MSAWKISLGSLCAVGFLKQLDFLGPFQDFYLEDTPFNLTREQVQYEVHPVFSYSYICVLILVTLITDIVYYKPVISLGILALVANTALLTWGRGLLVSQLAFFTKAFSVTTDIAFFSYAFAVIDPEKYRLAAGFSRAALLSGTLLGGTIGEILVHVLAIEYTTLNYVTFAFMCLSLIVSLFIPSAVLSPFQLVIERELLSPEHGRFQNPLAGSIQNAQVDIAVKRGDNSSLTRVPDNLNASLESGQIAFPPFQSGPMFYDIDTSSLGFSYNDMMSECSDMSSLDRTRIEEQQTEAKEAETIKEKFILSLNSAKETFTNKSVILLSVFWVFLTFIDFELSETIHPLLDSRNPGRAAFEVDGAVESVMLFIAVVLVLVTGSVRVTWTNGAFLMSAASMLLCLSLILMACLDNMWLNVTLYAGCRIVYQVVITIVMYEVAGFVNGRRFAFVFGLNMLVAGVLELVVTGARAADRDSEFPPFAQIWLYAAVHGALGVGLLVCSVYSIVSKRRSDSVRDDLDTLVHN